MSASDADGVGFHHLHYRRDGAEWIAGCRETGHIVAVPDIGMTAIRLLAEGRSIAETRDCLFSRTGRDIDVRAFAEGLASAGLVASIGDRRFPRADGAVTFPGIRQCHVRWAMSTPVHATVLILVLAGLAVAAMRPAALPSWSALVWNEYGAFVIITQSLVAWSLIFLHESAHLFTARAAGVPGRIRLSTRLQFLVAQTEVTGIWLGTRRERLTVYLSGLALDGALASACLIALAAGLRNPLLPVVFLTLLYTIAGQCLIFMRTDLYFVLQDLSGCRDLYGGATAWLRHAAARLLRRPHIDPSGAFTRRERSILRLYAGVVLLGTTACAVIALHVLCDATWWMVSRSVTVLVSSSSPLAVADAAATLAVLAGLQLLWGRMWWRRHRSTVATLAAAARSAVRRRKPARP